MAPKEFGIRFLCDEQYKGTCTVENVKGILSHDDGPPSIENVRTDTTKVPCFEKFEITFNLPDRYADPFDTNVIAVTAEIETPHGPVHVDGFYAIDYYCETNATGELVLPQGQPFWRVRYAPTTEGTHKFLLRARDRFGETKWGPGVFTATKATGHGYLRVSKTDARYFEFSDGTPYFPIGHNTRSPYDKRVDDNFPWRQRWPEGFSAYLRYFKSMADHGENLAEIWTASWSLGLEWTPRLPGYHGVGQYNMIHAWELDKVIEAAERRGINVNIVINNHGKFSTFSDEEWAFNPLNKINGGFLETPEDFFTDARADAAYIKLMHYMISRWGYSPRVFAWQVWSELNLTGSKKDGVENYGRKELVEWHRRMCGAIKKMDINAHMVASHVSADYAVQRKEIVQLPELDFASVDAYYDDADPLHIVDLLKSTAEFNNDFAKPVLVTEFGGTSLAQRLRFLSDTLHAGLWSSTCTPVAGTPLFWWWQLIEEENFYPEYTGVANFMKNEDPRDPTLKMDKLDINRTNDGVELKAVCIRNNRRARGWICRRADFSSVDSNGQAVTSNVVAALRNMSNGNYRVEFCDTKTGDPVTKIDMEVTNEVLSLNFPAFSRDIAFKARRQGR
jgi:hypothetical protein